MRIYRRLALFETDLEGSLQRPDFPTAPFCRGVLGACDVVTVDDPERGLRLAEIARRVAEVLGDRHLFGRSLQAMGAAFRALTRYGEAAAVYAKAGEFACGCACRDPGYRIREGDIRCGPDLHRRVAFLLLEQHQSREALRMAEEAVDATVEAEARARGLVCRGTALVYCREISSAVRDISAALKLLPLGGRWPWLREVREVYRSGGQLSLAWALSFTDKPDDVRFGLALFPAVRRRWKKLSPDSRAQLDWTEAALMLKACKLGIIPEADIQFTRWDAIEMLEDAGRNVASRLDAATVKTDLAAALLPDLYRIMVLVASMTPPPELAAEYERLRQARGVLAVTAALRRFRGAATALGAVPSIVPYGDP